MAKNDVVETMDLTMEGEPFDDLRRNFNIILQRLIKNMSDTDSDEAKISIAVEVKLDTEFIPEYKDGKQKGGRDIKKPTFKHKVTSAISVKDEESGVRNTEMELVWDEEQKMYVLKPVLGGEQMTMNDYMKQQADQEAKEAEQDKLTTDPDKKWMNVQQIEGPTADEGALPGPTADEGALPGPVNDDNSDNVIDGEFRELGEDETGEDGELSDEPESEEELIDDGTGEDDGYSYDEPENDTEGE